jgi:8-oxo-dGTP pyrophosphatase MutT (NUDIX family)
MSVIEYLDLYNKNKEKLNKKHKRGDKLSQGEYFLATNFWIVNDKKELLITQRHKTKSWPLKWECTGGVVLAGEDSYTGALREAEEEIGIKLETKGKLIDTVVKTEYIDDIYLFHENVDIEKVKLQEDEVINIKWVTISQFIKMVKNNEIAEPTLYNMEKLKENI